MRTQETLTRLCEKYTLGKIQGEPLPVTGGLLHRMYHVVTDQGDYAIKLLNPDIMKRPDALGNMVNSERIAERLAAYETECVAGRTSMAESKACRPSDTIPVVAALKFQGQHLLWLEQDSSNDLPMEPSTDIARQYALVYPWLEGQSLFAPEIGITHCRKIGRILGQIHHADLQLEGIEREEAGRLPYDWQSYLAMAREQQVPWLADYEAMLPNLSRWDQSATDAMEAVNAFQVISHRDLDPKNVLWQEFEPWIIDWEAAGYVNPYQELLEVLNYWGRDEDGNYAPALCHALLQEYIPFMDLQNVDWTPVFACSYDGMLGWLEYTLKKSLGLEGDDQARIQGPGQLLATYEELRRYDAQTEILREIIYQQIPPSAPPQSAAV